MKEHPGYIILAKELTESLLIYSKQKLNFFIYNVVELQESDFGNEFVYVAVTFSHGEKHENNSTWKVKLMRIDGEESKEGCTIFPSETEVIICKYDKLEFNTAIYFTVDHKTSGEKKWEKNTPYPLHGDFWKEFSLEKLAKIRRLAWI